MWKGLCLSIPLALAVISGAGRARAADSDDAGAAVPSPIPSESRQSIVVQSGTWAAVTGSLQRFERVEGGAWQALGAPIAVNVGRNGMAWGRGLQPRDSSGPMKREGDLRSPAGIFSLGSAFGYDDDPPEGAKGYPYLRVRRGTACIENARSRFYNQLIDPEAPLRPASMTGDGMFRSDGLFRWGIMVEHNAPEVLPGAGSCIFLHVWRGPGKSTQGCTAMAPEAITEIIRWLDVSEHPVLVQLPESEYTTLRSEWALP